MAKILRNKGQKNKIFQYICSRERHESNRHIHNQTVILPLYKSCIYTRKYHAALFRNNINNRSKQLD